MRGIISYAGFFALILLAMDMIAAPAGLGVAVGAGGSTLHYVDRSNKGNRLLTPAIAKQPAPATRPRMMAGCDPAFSPLSTSAYANYAARCMA